jgi:hypothetical protein
MLRTLRHVNNTDEKGPTMERTQSQTPLWAVVRDELRARGAERAARRTLERELSAYSTPAELNEIEAIFARYDGDEVAELREIVNRRRVA